MPLNRYVIRNEYSLADPDLYRVADRDDPEALLEGVAMAGLVGVLRQLGDLAEFAAEIFHDLHEEVMATAARGHGLIDRVQQLEAEFPSVERTLLSQTSHTAFLYNSGVDWHPNLRMDENLVTQGDLPRFVMDSYEECRGPPRLFLLDKFDVAGAGACLKRYTDPSFFKVEATSSTGRKSEGQREKKTRRVKKRGPRWRNGDTPETFPSSHAKLHQLFLEERIESGVNDPERRVKLKKRQFTGSLFDQDKGPSYMDRFLDTCTPEQKIVHEVCIDALPLPWTSDIGCESGLEIVEIGTVSPLKESVQADKSSCSSPDTGEMVVKPSMEEFSESKLNEIIASEAVELHGLNNESDGGKISSFMPKEVNGEEFADRESKSELGVDDGCHSDDAASEIDNYMDALATIESEVETDSECKKDRHYLNLKPIVVDSDASEGQRAPQSLFLDSQSVGNSVTSEDSTSFFKERESSSCSISVDTLAETTEDLDAAVARASNSAPGNIYSDHHSVSEEVAENKSEEHDVGSTAAVESDDISKSVQESGEASNTSCLTDTNTMILPVDMEESLREKSLLSPDLDEVYDNPPEPGMVSGMSDQGQANQTDIWACNGTVVADAPERAHSKPRSSGEHLMHDMAGLNSRDYSESLPDLSKTPNDLVDLLQIEPKNADSASSSVEEHCNLLSMADADACSAIRPSPTDLPIVDTDYTETVTSMDVASNVDFFIPSTKGHSKGQLSSLDLIEGSNIQERSSKTMNPDHTPSPDFAAGAPLPSSKDHSVKVVFADDEGEAKASTAPSIVGQTEALLSVSNRSETGASEFSFSEINDEAEKAAHGSLEDALAGVTSSGEPNSELVFRSADGRVMNSSRTGKSTPVLDTQDQGQKLPSEKADATLLEHHAAEAAEQYPGSISGTEYKATLNVGVFDSACLDDTSVYSDLSDAVETVKSLDDSETQETLVDVTSDRDRNDKLDFYNRLLFNIPSKHAKNNTESHHGMANMEHFITGADGTTRQVNVKDYRRENVHPLSSSSSLAPEVQEQPVSLTEAWHQYEKKLALRRSAQLAAKPHMDPVQDTSINSNPNTWHMSSHESPDLKLLNGSSVEDAQICEKSNVVEAQLTSENNSQDVESTSSDQIHLLEGKEDKVDPLSHNLQNGASKVKLFHDDESSSQSISYSRQIQTPEHVDREGILNAAALYYNGQPSVATLPPQSAVCALESSRQPMNESTSVFPGNNIFNNANQVTQRVENSGQPGFPPGFSTFGMLPAEPQNNLDAPPLPPLPPMQWRLSRFQNSSAARGRQMVQHTHGSVQPMTLPTTNNETETVVPASVSDGQPGYSDYAEQQGGHTLPITAAVSEASSQNSINGFEREDNVSFTSPLTSTQISAEETIQASVNAQGPGSVVESHTSQQNPAAEEAKLNTEIDVEIEHLEEPGAVVESHSSQQNPAAEESKLNTEIDVENEHLKEIPKVTEQEVVNSHVQLLPPSTVHYDWQPHPGLMAPETTGRTWSTSHDFSTNVAEYANGTLQKKPPRPRNPLIDEVVAIDKSKFRKVERVKQPVESKPEEGESLLEQMQLRKVERVKPPAEPKAQDREFSLEQLKLRKVGERVKPEVEQKPEETESPRVQLRKVEERIKPDVEMKPEETESPRMQLRKVGERAQSVFRPKIEDRGSLMEQIRNKSFNLKPAVAARPNIHQGPRTNLKVSAILEKASNIRQAMAGSDEEDDADSWSDC